MVFEPVMRTDEHHVFKHAQLLELSNNKDIDVVFLGDSITRRWEDNIDLWNTYFSSFRPANFGVGMDCVQHIKWRLLNGELDGMNPKALILLAGTNNLDTNTASEIVEGIGELLEIVQKKLPKTKVLCLAIYPRGPDENGIDYSEKILEINKALAELCVAGGFFFADIGSYLLGRDGEVQEHLQPDGLHPNHEGYAILGPVLADIIDKLLYRASLQDR